MSTQVHELPFSERVRICKVQTLSDDWYVLKKTTFDFLRNDGTWQRQIRETYDRGNGATLLLYNLERRTVILTRQFRFPAFVNGHSGLLIEAAAGLLDDLTREFLAVRRSSASLSHLSAYARAVRLMRSRAARAFHGAR